MKLARALGRHMPPMMIVIPLGLLGIVPALTLLFIAFCLVLIAGWLGGKLIERLGLAVSAGVNPSRSMRSLPRHATGEWGGGPTRW